MVFQAALVLASFTIIAVTPRAEAQNETTVGKIRQVFIEQNRAIGEVSTSAVATKDFVVTFDDKSQCVLKAVDTKDRLVSLDLSSCAQKFDVKAGMSFEPSLLFGANATQTSVPVAAVAPPSPAPPTVAVVAANPVATKAEPAATPAIPEPERKSDSLNRKPNRVRVGVGLALGASPSSKFTDGSITGSTVRFDTEFNFNGGVSFYADVRSLEKYDWGFIAALSHDFEREISSVKLTAGNNSTTISASGSKLSATLAEFNLAYRWSDFYLPFGLNYSHFKFQDDSPTLGYEIRGGVGLQLGLGFYVTDSFVVELWSRATTMKFKVMSGGVTQDYGSGTYASGTIGFKALF